MRDGSRDHLQSVNPARSHTCTPAPPSDAAGVAVRVTAGMRAFERFRCSDYLQSPYARDGRWDEGAQLWLIEPVSRVAEHPGIDLLQIGRPGVDGIGFGYRAGFDGLWVYYPAFGEFERVASTVSELVEGWERGSISV